MAEHSYFPRTFAILPGTVAGAAGGETPVMRLQFLDVGGDMIHVVMGLEDFAAFKEACADPDAFRKKLEARSKLTLAADLPAEAEAPMSGETRALLRRVLSSRARERAAAAASAYLSLERCYPQLALFERAEALAPDGHGRSYLYRRGCRCDWCREAERQAKARYRARAAA